MIRFAKLAVNIAKGRGMYVVLDADALWMLDQDLALIDGYRRAVLTPNVVEFKRLSESVVSIGFWRFTTLFRSSDTLVDSIEGGSKRSSRRARDACLSRARRCHGSAERQRRHDLHQHRKDRQAASRDEQDFGR